MLKKIELIFHLYCDKHHYGCTETICQQSVFIKKEKSANIKSKQLLSVSG